MSSTPKRWIKRIQKSHFQVKHLLVIFFILIFFLILILFVQKTSVQELLVNTQNWYQQDSAERMANLTATTLELLIEQNTESRFITPRDKARMIKALDILLSQQQLQQSVYEVCILVQEQEEILAIDDGETLYNYFFRKGYPLRPSNQKHMKALQIYQQELMDKLQKDEQIYSIREGEQTFHVFVPFVPKGEYVGAVYIKNIPDFSFITRKIITSYDEIALIFASLITLGLIAMFYISSYTVKERDETQKLLFQEQEKYLMEKMDREKEELFTKRIYHTHHKAEKVMGFIKEDLRNLSCDNIEEIKNRLSHYANFVSRVIYDMKWYDPPLHTIRNPMFRTNLNEVLRFIVENIFLRTSQNVNYQFHLELDENLPTVSVNEFVVWEIIEPLIQNCIEHSGSQSIEITILTRYDSENKEARIIIQDNGKGFSAELMETDETGVKKLFLEHITTKTDSQNSGYGCYISHQIATRRCGWKLDAENIPSGGGRYLITIPIQM